MRIDDLIDSLFKDVVRPPSVDANSPGEMVRAQLAGQMPGQAPAPRPIAGAPVAPVARSPLPAPMGAGVSSAAPAASPAPAPLRLNPLGSLARGYQSGGLIGGIANMFDEPALLERQQQEKARAEQQALAQQNQTVQFLVTSKGMDPTQAALVARNPALLQKYLAPSDPNADLNRRKTEAEIAKLEREAKGGDPAKAPNVQTFFDEKTGREVKRQWNGSEWVQVGGAKAAGENNAPDIKEYQAKAADFGSRMLRAEKVLDEIMGFDPKTQTFKGYNPANNYSFSPDEPSWSNLYTANLVNSDEWKRYYATAKDTLAAILRKDTGAAVTPDEFNQYARIYLPMPGDDDKTILDKKRRREEVARGMVLGSGPAFQAMFPDQAAATAAPGAAPAAGAAPVRISSDEHWAQLPPGTKYIDPEGNERVKQ